jgi:hypothetical protein
MGCVTTGGAKEKPKGPTVPAEPSRFGRVLIVVFLLLFLETGEEEEEKEDEDD